MFNELPNIRIEFSFLHQAKIKKSLFFKKYCNKIVYLLRNKKRVKIEAAFVLFQEKLRNEEKESSFFLLDSLFHV